MHNATVLDLADLPQFATPAKRVPMLAGLAGTPRRALAVLLLVAAALALALGTRAAGGADQAALASVNFADLQHVEDISVDDKAQIVVEGEAAQVRNAGIPFSSQPVELAKAFGLAAASHETYDTALKCLTQAVYYEAAVEPLEGRRAVAQVVLNRVKHPAYPKSV